MTTAQRLKLMPLISDFVYFRKLAIICSSSSSAEPPKDQGLFVAAAALGDLVETNVPHAAFAVGGYDDEVVGGFVLDEQLIFDERFAGELDHSYRPDRETAGLNGAAGVAGIPGQNHRG